MYNKYLAKNKMKFVHFTYSNKIQLLSWQLQISYVLISAALNVNL